MISQYYNDELLEKLNVILEEIDAEKEDQEEVTESEDEETEDELEEGSGMDLAAKIAKAIAGTGADLAKALAKGTVEGILGPKEDRLLASASTDFAELLRMSGINVTDETTKKLLDRILTKNVVKYVEKKREQQKKGSGASFANVLKQGIVNK